jgi:hypothetical protein
MESTLDAQLQTGNPAWRRNQMRFATGITII